MTVADPTADQLADFRADLGDGGATPAFTDAELTRLWQRAAGDPTRALLYAVRQLLAVGAKLHDYSFGMGTVQQSQSQVYKNLQAWEQRLRVQVGGGLASVPLATTNTVKTTGDGLPLL